MSLLRCSGCGASREPDDNFCRRCGRQITVNLPAVRSENLPVATPALPPSLVGSIAVLALGTGIEWLARRMAGSAARAAGRALVGRAAAQPAKREAGPDAVSVEEVLYIRQVRLRR